MNERLVEALYIPADDRVRRRVDELCEIYGKPGEAVDIPLTQEELAGMAGTSRATVNRVLRRALAAGEIRLRRGHITVSQAPEKPVARG